MNISQFNGPAVQQSMKPSLGEDQSVLKQSEAAPRVEWAAGAPPPARSRLGRLTWIAVVFLLLALIAGFVPRWRARGSLARETLELAAPAVGVSSPASGISAPGVPVL